MGDKSADQAKTASSRGIQHERQVTMQHDQSHRAAIADLVDTCRLHPSFAYYPCQVSSTIWPHSCMPCMLRASSEHQTVLALLPFRIALLPPSHGHAFPWQGRSQTSPRCVCKWCIFESLQRRTSLYCTHALRACSSMHPCIPTRLVPG